MGGRTSSSGMGKASGTSYDSDGLRMVDKLNEDWFYLPEPGTKLSDLRMNPIPYVGTGIDEELDSKLNGRELPTVDTRRTEVNLSDLKTLQPLITKEGYDRAVRGEAGMGHPVKVVQYNGQMYLLDGNHRAAAALMRGDKTITASVTVKGDRVRRYGR